MLRRGKNLTFDKYMTAAAFKYHATSPQPISNFISTHSFDKIAPYTLVRIKFINYHQYLQNFGNVEAT